ncbi:Teneurin-2 [Bagarius yarrelli]|uniref:Teneurin-2 n=1 Tax=Bagarius yarrelli TaxID=175774 RepID=A0A556UY32_BAGYA|nr:Teneurin-2 [Bagarius yarrelli]
MDLKERRHRSLTRERCAKELQFTTSTLDVPTQKSFSTSEALKVFEHEARLPYGGCVADLVHHETDEYSRQRMGNFTLAELGICESTPHQNTYCPNLGLLHGYTLSAGSDADSDPEGPISPERAMQLWSTRNVKSRHSSGQSSHENSALTLTDSENENKSDDESVLVHHNLRFHVSVLIPCHPETSHAMQKVSNERAIDRSPISLLPVSHAPRASSLLGPHTPGKVVLPLCFISAFTSLITLTFKSGRGVSQAVILKPNPRRFKPCSNQRTRSTTPPHV